MMLPLFDWQSYVTETLEQASMEREEGGKEEGKEARKSVRKGKGKRFVRQRRMSCVVMVNTKTTNQLDERNFKDIITWQLFCDGQPIPTQAELEDGRNPKKRGEWRKRREIEGKWKEYEGKEENVT